jgi:hypothetical protein
VVMRVVMRVVVHVRSVCEPGGMRLATIHMYPGPRSQRGQPVSRKLPMINRK